MPFDWHTALGTISSILLLTLIIPYIRSVIYSTTRPNPISWFGWALLAIIATIAQASQGMDWSIIVPALTVVSTAIIFVVALKVGKLEWTKIDGLSIALATIAVLLWLLTSQPLLAILLSIVADIFVMLPTILKTYKEPDSEPATLWILYTFGALLALVATRELTMYNLLYPTYAVIGSGAIAILAARQWVRPKVTF